MSQETILAGWKLVPIEPTLTMRSAANMEHNRHSGMDPLLPQAVYRAMLAAAPVPPVDVVRLAALNAQLLEALQALESIGVLEDGTLGGHGGIPQAQELARAAIATASGDAA